MGEWGKNGLGINEDNAEEGGIKQKKNKISCKAKDCFKQTVAGNLKILCIHPFLRELYKVYVN